MPFLRFCFRRAPVLFGAIALQVSPLVLAQADKALEVLRVQAPAQLVRASSQHVLLAQRQMLAGDRITTGADGRVLFDFVDGTAIRLGANSSIELPRQSPIVMTPNLSVLKLNLRSGSVRIDGRGATGVAQDVRLSLAEEVRVRIESADVWAEVAGARRTVCVFFGTVELQGVAGIQRLDQPGECAQVEPSAITRLAPDADNSARRLTMTAFADEVPPAYAKRGSTAVAASGMALPRSAVGPVPVPAAPVAVPVRSPASAEAPPSVGLTPATGGDHGWTLVAAALADGESAQLEAKGLADMGLPAQVRTVTAKNGQTLYRVAIGSFASRAEAAAYGEQIKGRYGLAQIWPANY